MDNGRDNAQLIDARHTRRGALRQRGSNCRRQLLPYGHSNMAAKGQGTSEQKAMKPFSSLSLSLSEWFVNRTTARGVNLRTITKTITKTKCVR